jgi:hypothetical protein
VATILESADPDLGLGKVGRIEYFRHRSDAMEAAGLSG